MSDILVTPVGSLARWHSDEKTVGTLNNLETSYYEGVIKGHANVTLQAFFIPQSDPDLCYLQSFLPAEKSHSL